MYLSQWQAIKRANCKDLFITMIYGGKFGIVNSGGIILIPPVFNYISPFDAQTGPARNQFNPQRKGYLTTDGTPLFGTQCQDCE